MAIRALGQDRLTITPIDLEEDTQYRLMIVEGVVDFAGDPMDPTFELTFKIHPVTQRARQA